MTVLIVSDPKNVPTKPVDGKPTFVYWDIVGLANPCRLVLALAGADFVDVRINPGDKNDPSDYKQTWLVAKETSVTEAMALPNLPFYMEEGVGPFSQSDAILRFFGRKYNLMGVPGKEYITDMCIDELKDYEGQYVSLSYGHGPEAMKVWLDDTVPQILTKWARLLGDQPYLTGDQVSVADIKLYWFLCRLKILQSKTAALVDNTKEWTTFMTKIESLPKLKEYLASSDFMQEPLNNPHAKVN
jgi:glutathione S-transferase